MATRQQKAGSAKPPPLGWAIAELPRALIELATLAAAHKILTKAPRGDGHPVVSIPGYRSNDSAMLVLRRYLRRWRYEPYPWGLGTNLGVGYERLDYEKRLIRRVERIVAKHGEKATLIGWSQGGVIAREITKHRPDLVRQVITLGSPVADAPEATTLFRIFKQTTSGEISSELMNFLREVSTPLPNVRCVCIYSNTDGIVSPDIAQDLVSPNVENICLNVSHFGMTVNPLVLYVIGDRLAQPEDAWEPFNFNAFSWLRSVAS